MSLRYIKRLLTDITEVQKDEENDINISFLNDRDIKRLNGVITGPKDSYYEGGLYFLDIKIPYNYPIVAPEVKFKTKIWHPNISSASGYICLDILKHEWRPVISLKTILLSIKILLSNPNGSDPQDAVVASQFNQKKELFIKTAKFWTQEFANDNNANIYFDEEFNEKITSLEKKGFEKKQIIMTLSWNDWEVDKIDDNSFTN